MSAHTNPKIFYLATATFLTALFLHACGPSQIELDNTATQVSKSTFASQTAAAPTPTPEPLDTPIPSETPAPTFTPTLTATPTKLPPETLELDTSDLFVLPVFSFLFPSGWDYQYFNPPDGHYQEMQPILFFSSPDENSSLTFEITSISDLGNDSSQALQKYSDLRSDYLQSSNPETEVINQQGSLTFSAEAVSQSHQLEWVDKGRNLEGFTMIGLDPTGSYGYLFEGVQEIGETNLENIVMLPWTSFFPLAVTRDSPYAPFAEKISEYGFVFRYPTNSQTNMGDFQGTSDQPLNIPNGRFTFQPPWEESYSTYLAWVTPENAPGEKTLEEYILNDIAQEDGPVEILEQGNLHLGNDYAEIITEGRYIMVDNGAGQVMIAAWQCPDDERLLILHLENNQSEIGMDTLYLFQRYLIGFTCQYKPS